MQSENFATMRAGENESSINSQLETLWGKTWKFWKPGLSSAPHSALGQFQGDRLMKKAKTARKQKLPPLDNKDEVRSPEPSTLSGEILAKPARHATRGTGADSAGQSGDLQDLSREESADSESVEELVAEGQYREAEIISAIEEADDPDQREVHTREVSQDDVPEEYRDDRR